MINIGICALYQINIPYRSVLCFPMRLLITFESQLQTPMFVTICSNPVQAFSNLNSTSCILHQNMQGRLSDQLKEGNLANLIFQQLINYQSSNKWKELLKLLVDENSPKLVIEENSQFPLCQRVLTLSSWDDPKVFVPISMVLRQGVKLTLISILVSELYALQTFHKVGAQFSSHPHFLVCMCGDGLEGHHMLIQLVTDVKSVLLWYVSSLSEHNNVVFLSFV